MRAVCFLIRPQEHPKLFCIGMASCVACGRAGVKQSSDWRGPALAHSSVCGAPALLPVARNSSAELSAGDRAQADGAGAEKWPCSVTSCHFSTANSCWDAGPDGNSTGCISDFPSSHGEHGASYMPGGLRICQGLSREGPGKLHRGWSLVPFIFPPENVRCLLPKRRDSCRTGKRGSNLVRNC